MADVESLQLKITGNAKSAEKSIEKLIETLDKLKKATAGGCGLSAVADDMEKVDKAGKDVSDSNTKSAKSFGKLGLKIAAAALALKKGGKIVASWINESNNYIETVNLFTVAMGKYAESAKQYADEVGEIMGIDPATWMRNQGVFMTLTSGFGVASDRAAKMSEQLTQLGYDISSFYNISVEEAMTKLKSGISGELEPLRQLGYDLSQAKLEAVALSLGIDKTVSSMTQAEKAELRYYAIMTQVTTAHGDMARTLDAPANQLKVLKEQVTQAARALGNIFIPVLNAILPYAIAFLKVIREIANELAKLMGITITDVDYSGVGNLESAVEDLSGSMDDATTSAKALRKALLGVDELNVLGDNAGTLGGIGGGIGFDFELPAYDFMSGVAEKADEAYRTVKKMLTPLKNILEMLVEYKEIVLAGLGLIALVKVWGKLKTFWAWFQGLKLVDAFLSGFSLIKVTGGNVFQSLVGGLDNVRANLTTMQKAAIVAVAGFVEFAVVKENVKDIAMGCDNVGGKLVGIGAAAGAAAAAMYVALGPAGLVVAALVALAGVIVGVTQAQNEMMTAMSNEVFYSGTGVYIGDVADAYARLMDSIVKTHQPIIDNQAAIDDLRGSVDDTTRSIDGIATALSLSAVTASEKIEEIKTLFGQLKKDTETIMTDIYNNIVEAVGGSFGQALIAAGQSIPEVLEILKQLRGEGESTFAGLQTELDNLTNDLEAGKITHEEFGQRWLEIEEKMKALIGTTDEYTGVFDTLKESIGNINWGDETAKNDFFSQVTSSSAEAKDAINQAADSIIDNLETMKNWTTDANLKMKIDEWIRIAEADRQRQLDAIDNELTALYDAVQEDMIRKVANVKNEAVEAWNEMSWLDKILNGGDEEAYVQKAIRNYMNNVVDPIGETIDASFEKLGIDGATWASDAMEYILEALFNQRVIGYGSTWDTYVEYTGSIEDAISGALENAARGASETAREAGAAVNNSIGDGLAGSDAFAGVVDGLLNDTLSTSTAASHGSAFGRSLGNGMVNAIKKIEFPALKGTLTASSDGTATFKVKALAEGGILENGEMFIAREAGPEMVGSIGNRTAVANNDQIVDSVSQGVYRAVVQAMGQSSGSQVVEAKVNDKVLFEVVVNRNRQETIRTGYSPLLGGV